ncbi:hypothetical protein [Spirosoma sordidisoli]|uniref:Uncharacterized protein n=1 Tax=Spirosoma sordidisoli TaxID=2502893 RepID=A0A4Q2UUS6_9BACT|nr:hypothetical protein [Spirosoma sordidisoli]RYC70649.1 hypothetical protein EQG79_00420 [Spirosoma sordidisoli]
MSFWQYFFGLFAGMPPEVGQFFAKLIGGSIALIFFPPTGWRGGFSQIAVSFFVSHYAAATVQRKWMPDWPVESVYAIVSFAGWAIMSVVAAILTRIKGNPDQALNLFDTLAQAYSKWRNISKPGNDGTNNV